MKPRAADPSRVDNHDAEFRVFRSSRAIGHELLAIEPTALDLEFLVGKGANPTTWIDDGRIAIVHIRGPLEQHASYCWDSYEDIVARVEVAMSGTQTLTTDAMEEGHEEPDARDDHDPACAVILCLDSPGGLASGSMYVHQKLRSLSDEYKCPLYAYANETANSAAYAIASACDEIWLPVTGVVGSIGVIATVFDRTKENAKRGQLVELITSGAYKGDGHADRVLDDGIRGRMQARVDSFADVFFRLVATARGTTPKAIAGLEAGVFVGQDAVDVGVADGVERWDRFLELVSSRIDDAQDDDEPKTGPAPKTGKATMTDETIDSDKKMKAALRRISRKG